MNSKQWFYNSANKPECIYQSIIKIIIRMILLTVYCNYINFKILSDDVKLMVANSKLLKIKCAYLPKTNIIFNTTSKIG